MSDCEILFKNHQEILIGMIKKTTNSCESSYN